MPHRADLASALAEVAREINSQHDLASTLDAIVRAAQRSVAAVDHVGISLTHRTGTIQTVAATGRLVWDLDTLQYTLHEGPCYDAIREEGVFLAEDLTCDGRWPRYAPRAVEYGVMSQMGLRLCIGNQILGALNLYSAHAGGIDADQRHLAELLATHAALAIGRAGREDDLQAAVSTRKMIGQAIGIVMERYQMDENLAFHLLIHLSSQSKVELSEIAQTLVDQGNRPRVDG